MELKFKKLNSRAVLPTKAHRTDAGLDLTCTSMCYDNETKTYTYGSGLAVEIPEGYVGLLFPRSSVYKTGFSMCNCVGVIDAGYRGEITAKFYKAADVKMYHEGDRFCQLIVMPIPDVETQWADDLSESERGTGGYGSSGK